MSDDPNYKSPERRLDPWPGLDQFEAAWFGAALHQLGEPPLHPAERGCPLVIRLLCLPTWAPACSVLVEQDGPNWTLVARELDGEEAGFDLGELRHHECRRLTSDEADQVAKLWRYLCLSSLGPVDSDVLDGTTYVIEAVESGTYHIAHRDDWEWGETFGEFTLLLLKIACLTPR